MFEFRSSGCSLKSLKFLEGRLNNFMLRVCVSSPQDAAPQMAQVPEIGRHVTHVIRFPFYTHAPAVTLPECYGVSWAGVGFDTSPGDVRGCHHVTLDDVGFDT